MGKKRKSPPPKADTKLPHPNRQRAPLRNPKKQVPPTALSRKPSPKVPPKVPTKKAATPDPPSRLNFRMSPPPSITRIASALGGNVKETQSLDDQDEDFVIHPNIPSTQHYRQLSTPQV